MPNQPKTPARSIRLSDSDWELAERIAADLARETGLAASRSDAVRLGLLTLARQRGLAGEVEKKSRKQS